MLQSPHLKERNNIFVVVVVIFFLYIVSFFSSLGSYIQRTQSIKFVNINYRKISQTDESLDQKHILVRY